MTDPKEDWTAHLTDTERDILDHSAMEDDLAVREEGIENLARTVATLRALVEEQDKKARMIGVAHQMQTHQKMITTLECEKAAVPGCYSCRLILQSLALTEEEMQKRLGAVSVLTPTPFPAHDN